MRGRGAVSAGVILIGVAVASVLFQDSLTQWISRRWDTWTAEVPSDQARLLDAVFNDPSGIWIDSGGRVFFSDRRTHVLRAFAKDRVTTIAGTGRKGFSGDDIPATKARFHFPEGLAGDGAGNLFIADSRNHRIRREIS